MPIHQWFFANKKFDQESLPCGDKVCCYMRQFFYISYYTGHQTKYVTLLELQGAPRFVLKNHALLLYIRLLSPSCLTCERLPATFHASTFSIYTLLIPPPPHTLNTQPSLLHTLTKLLNMIKLFPSVLIFLFLLPLAFADLRVGFYTKSCPSAEAIVRRIVQKRFNRDRSITAGLLRMHFHDCFVRGCDASILIDPKGGKGSEKQAGANASVRGYELIDEIKKALEKACPSIVSCADIITLATRESVVLAGGSSYAVPTGRRDGLVSNPNEVNVPGPSSSVSQSLQSFAAKGLTLTEMVALLGAHTVGFTHCNFVQGRLSSFGSRDPAMDPALDSQLGKTCGSSSRPARNNPRLFLDQNTSFIFDNEFYNQILKKRGLLKIDQNLAEDASSRGIVSGFASNGGSFMQSFANAMIKMGNIEVLVGNAGEIRKNCRAFNQ